MMADVPAWLLVFQTVAVGGVGLAGSFIVPRAQRESRRSEALEKSHSIMREKAEQIFCQISRSRPQLSRTMQKIVSVLALSKDTTQLDFEGLGVVHEIAGLVATYYPGGLPILENARAELEASMAASEAAIEAAGSAGSIGSKVGRQLRIQQVLHVHKISSNCLLDLEMFMLKAVQPYAPGKGSLDRKA